MLAEVVLGDFAERAAVSRGCGRDSMARSIPCSLAEVAVEGVALSNKYEISL